MPLRRYFPLTVPQNALETRQTVMSENPTISHRRCVHLQRLIKPTTTFYVPTLWMIQCMFTYHCLGFVTPTDVRTSMEGVLSTTTLLRVSMFCWPCMSV